MPSVSIDRDGKHVTFRNFETGKKMVAKCHHFQTATESLAFVEEYLENAEKMLDYTTKVEEEGHAWHLTKRKKSRRARAG